MTSKKIIKVRKFETEGKRPSDISASSPPDNAAFPPVCLRQDSIILSMIVKTPAYKSSWDEFYTFALEL